MTRFARRGVIVFRGMVDASITESLPIDTTLEIDTPEQIRFSFRLAGPAQRAGAYLIDLVVRGTLMSFVGMGMLLANWIGDGFGIGLALVIVFLIEWGYYIASEMLMGGQSIGKRAMHLRVVRENGLPLSFSDSLLRNLLRAADFLPAFNALGLVVLSVDKKFRRLGDLVAGTIVVFEERQTIRPLIAIEPPPSPEELQRLPRQLDLTPTDLQALDLFLRRSGQLNPAREHELAEMVAPIYAKRFDVRYKNPVRFLALLYYRATHGEAG